MGSLVTEFSQPISEDSPSGDNLEYEADFLEMYNLFEPKARAGSSAADEGEEAQPPDWKGVEKLATSLLSKSHDFRILVCLAIATLHTKGIESFRDSLELLDTYLLNFWDSAHPQLDEDDNNDATMRMNAIEALDEYRHIAPALEQVRLVQMQGVGQFGVREVDLAQGKETPREGEEVVDIGLIRQAFMQTDPAQLVALREAAQGSVDLCRKIQQSWEDQSGGQAGPSFDNALKALGRVISVLDELTPAPVTGEAGGTVAGEATGDVPSGAIRSRADVVRVLENICQYYSVNEPSSPIPLLLRRAQRLVEKSFMEILEDIVPDSVQQARIVSGADDNE